MNYGPLITLKPGLDVKELKKRASIDKEYIKPLVTIIKAQIKKILRNPKVARQRFAVNWGADEKQNLNVVLGATLPSDATGAEIEALNKLIGLAIIARKDLPGIVHDELSEIDYKEHTYRFRGGLSFYIVLKKNDNGKWNLWLGFTNRSTRQYESQDFNPIAEMTHFYDFGSGPLQTKYDEKENKFYNRKYSGVFHIKRGSVMPITKLIANTIIGGLVDYIGKYDSDLNSEIFQYKTITLPEDCRNPQDEKDWDDNFRENKDNIADALLTTICVACGYNDNTQPGPFWPKKTDSEIVFDAMLVADDNKIPLNLNEVPKQLKRLYGQNFSTTALMFAAKKTDMSPKRCFNLVVFLIKKGADPDIKDKNGHDASWYAQQAGNTDIGEYLRTLSRCRYSVKNGRKIDVEDFLKIIKFTAPQYEGCKFSEGSESEKAISFIEKNRNQLSFDFSLKFLKKIPEINKIIKIIESDFIENLSNGHKDTEFNNYDQYLKMVSELKNNNFSGFSDLFNQLDFSGDIHESVQTLKMIFDFNECSSSSLKNAFEQFISSGKDKISGQTPDVQFIRKLMIAQQFLEKNDGEYKHEFIQGHINDYKKIYQEDQYAVFLLEVINSSYQMNDEILSIAQNNQWLESSEFKSAVRHQLHKLIADNQIDQIKIILKYYPTFISDFNERNSLLKLAVQKTSQWDTTNIFLSSEKEDLITALSVASKESKDIKLITNLQNKAISDAIKAKDYPSLRQIRYLTEKAPFSKGEDFILKMILESDEKNESIEPVVQFLIENEKVNICANIEDKNLLEIAKENNRLSMLEKFAKPSFFDAIKEDDQSKFNTLLKYYPKLAHEPFRDGYNDTPLMLTTHHCREEMAKKLLEIDQIDLLAEHKDGDFVAGEVNFDEPNNPEKKAIYNRITNLIKDKVIIKLSTALINQDIKSVKEILKHYPKLIGDACEWKYIPLELLFEGKSTGNEKSLLKLILKPEYYSLYKVKIDKIIELLPTLSESRLNSTTFVDLMKHLFASAMQNEQQTHYCVTILKYFPNFINEKYLVRNREHVPLLFAAAFINNKNLVEYLLKTKPDYDLWEHKKIWLSNSNNESLKLLYQHALEQAWTRRNRVQIQELINANKVMNPQQLLIDLLNDADFDSNEKDKLIRLLLSKGVKLPLENPDFLKKMNHRSKQIYEEFLSDYLQQSLDKTTRGMGQGLASWFIFTHNEQDALETYVWWKRKIYTDLVKPEGKAAATNLNIGQSYQKIVKVECSAARQLLLKDYIDLIYQQQLLDTLVEQPIAEKEIFSNELEQIIFDNFKEIAQDPIWETQGVGFFHRHLPTGIRFINDDQCKNYQNIIDKIKPQLKDKSGFARSAQTYGFYELIVTIDRFLKQKNRNGLLNDQQVLINTSRIVMDNFCKTWSLKTGIHSSSSNSTHASKFN